jgi:AraC-like DNA-binding protein
MLRNQLKGFGARWELFFENRAPNPAGCLLRAGISRPQSESGWWDVRAMRARPNYVLSILMEKGAGSYRNENGFECQLTYGNFFLIFPGFKQIYSPGINEQWHELYVGFNGQIFDCLRDNGFLSSAQPVWSLNDPAPWLQRLFTLLEAPRPASAIEITREAAHFATFLLEMVSAAQPVDVSTAPSDWFHHACVLLTNDLSQKIRLESVATELGMSYSTFRSYFTQRAGMPPARYRDLHRIKAACEQLEKTSNTCRNIAANLGYCNEQYFSTAFKAATGYSPQEYRRKKSG